MEIVRAIHEWLSDAFGLDAGVLGDQALLKALDHRCRRLECLDLGQYGRIWSQDPGERENFLKMLLVGETWFFRERPAFDALLRLCTERIEQSSVNFSPRVLVLPCATGEEAWSVAAVLKVKGLESARIDAIDLHPEFIEVARKGNYSQRRLRDVSVDPLWLDALGEIDQGEIRIDQSLKSMVVFEVGNARNPELLNGRLPYDFIFCRNLLIYLHAEARRKLLNMLVGHLKSEGLLFLGHAEHLPADFGFFRDARVGAFAWKRGPGGGLDEKQKIQPGIRDYPGVPSSSTRLQRRSSLSDRTAGSVAESATRDPVQTPLNPRELADQGALELALDTLKQQGLEYSLDPSAHGLAGVLLDALGREEEAVGRFRRALFLDPGHAESLAHLALLLEHLGRHHEATRLRKRLVEGGG